jgi:hypothetical protein
VDVQEIKNTQMSNKLVIRCSATNKEGGGIEEEGQQPIPEEIMNKLEPYVGDGLARFSVGNELGSSVAFGFKAQAMVNATVTCNNDTDTLVAVNDILYPVVEELVVRNHERMSALRDQMLPDPKDRLNLSTEFEAEPQAPARPVKSGPPAKAMAKPAAQTLVKKPVPGPKPTFKRG